MKSNAPPPLYFSLYAMNSSPKESPAKAQPPQSPYLKAILSPKGSTHRPSAPARMVNADRLAAIRYIRECRNRDNK